jgi:hypothetical protein
LLGKTEVIPPSMEELCLKYLPEKMLEGDFVEVYRTVRRFSKPYLFFGDKELYKNLTMYGVTEEDARAFVEESKKIRRPYLKMKRRREEIAIFGETYEPGVVEQEIRA